MRFRPNAHRRNIYVYQIYVKHASQVRFPLSISGRQRPAADFVYTLSDFMLSHTNTGRRMPIADKFKEITCSMIFRIRILYH